MTIKEIREIKGLSRQDLADMLNIPKRTIESWEGGARKAPVYVTELIADKVLNLSEKEIEQEKKYCVLKFSATGKTEIAFTGSRKECNEYEDAKRAELTQEERFKVDYSVKKLSEYTMEKEYLEALEKYEDTLTYEERNEEVIVDGKKCAKYILDFKKFYYNK